MSATTEEMESLLSGPKVAGPAAPLPTVEGGEEAPAIERMGPGTELHAQVLEKLRSRLRASEKEMEKFYWRWRCAEKRIQAYISLPDYEQLLKNMNDEGKPPAVVDITVPYSFATIQTIVTYLIQTFCGRKPMFQVGSNKAQTVQSSRNMETMLQYNADHTRMIAKLFRFFGDGETYGLGAMRTEWQNKKAIRTVRKLEPYKFLGLVIPGMKGTWVKSKESRTVFQGTDVLNIDPYMFFPDPRVPISEVAQRGEFVFWRTFEGKHTLRIAESDGLVRWVDQIPAKQQGRSTADSARSYLSGGEPHPGRGNSQSTLKDFVQLDQGTVELVPKDWGLGESTRPEKWIFSLANDAQIIQAEPFEADHGKHPVVINEPYAMGYGFGNPGMGDYLGPLQDTVSWFVNSHIHNVRASLNNMFVVDPSMIEMADLRNPEPGKLLRLKRAAYGRDVRQAVQQFQVQDITRGHMPDLEMFMKMGDGLSAVTDNIRGLQDSGGRKSATEARTSLQAAASRLASHAMWISGHSIVGLTEQMVLNYQQNLEDEFYLTVVGEDGVAAPVTIPPEALTGDFYYPVNDGTLPLDRVALLDVWKEILTGVASDPELRQQYSLGAIFEYVAELGGAKDVSRFKAQGQPGIPQAGPQVQINPMQNTQVAAQAQAGNVVPIEQAMAGLRSR